jgi:hypothetical protein
LNLSDKIPGIEEFLRSQPFMSIQPSHGEGLALEGFFELNHAAEGHPAVTDSYRLRIDVPSSFPQELPFVTELDGKIPHNEDYHNGGGRLCLGSPLRLMLELQKDPDIHAFSQRLIVPFLYAMSLKLKYSTPFVFGELRHGVNGELDDYRELLGLEHNDQVIYALQCLLKKKRLANKMTCPCGCRRRLGQCNLNTVISNLRKMLPKDWLRTVIGMRK